MKMKQFLTTGLVVAASLCLAACGNSSSSSEKNGLEAIQEKGKLVVATSPDYAPFEFQTLVDGKNKIVGSDMAMAQAIADELGVELEISPMSFDNVLNSVQTGKADLAIAGLTINEERQKVFDFSVPYYEVSDVVVVQKGNTANYTDVATLAGKSVGVQKGTTQETFVNEHLTDSTVISLPTMSEVVNQLKSGQLDAMVLDSVVAKGYLAQNDDLAIPDMDLSSFNKNSKAIAMAKGNDELKAAVDKVLTKMNEENTYQTYLDEAIALNNAE